MRALQKSLSTSDTEGACRPSNEHAKARAPAQDRMEPKRCIQDWLARTRNTFFFFSRGRMKSRGHTQNWRSQPRVTAIANHIRCGGRGPVRNQTSTAIQQGQGESPSGAARQHVPPPPEPTRTGRSPSRPSAHDGPWLWQGVRGSG